MSKERKIKKTVGSYGGWCLFIFQIYCFHSFSFIGEHIIPLHTLFQQSDSPPLIPQVTIPFLLNNLQFLTFQNVATVLGMIFVFKLEKIYIPINNNHNKSESHQTSNNRKRHGSLFPSPTLSNSTTMKTMTSHLKNHNKSKMTQSDDESPLTPGIGVKVNLSEIINNHNSSVLGHHFLPRSAGTIAAVIGNW
ncbi:hypothetical protein CTI12_AA596060 [Artemisia annua]|uniref:Uncharacterized protein n=1 Tax=Artemisia annua TaxID=35608 RepID=A0A2U1KJ90_ARTAN|nr:hypothetical protein CTI12_AA596060 [Artemisia annua]